MGFDTSWKSVVLRRGLAPLVVALLVLSGLSPSIRPAPVAAQETQQIPYGDVIVVLQEGVDPSLFASASGVAPAFVYDTLITGFAANLTAEAARRLAQVPQVEGIFPDLPVDPTAQVIPTGIERVNAPRNGFFPFTNGSGGSVGGTVAVVDSGVAPLADLNVIGGYNCTSPDTGDWADGFGHGTHVAGTVGAINNTDGVVGVAPGVGIFAARMLNSAGGGSQSQLVCALEAVAAQGGIRVANLSLTTNDSTPGTCGVNASALHQAICNLIADGTSVVVAAGNFGQEVTATSMAGYPEVIAVSAFQDFDGRPGGLSATLCASGSTDDTFWASSNWGPLVDIMGPGVCIRSYNQSGVQVYRSGTSMATPHVSGALALYYAANPGASVSAARSWVLGTAAISQSAAGVSGGKSGEPVLSLGPDLPTPTPTATRTATATGTPTFTATPSSTFTATATATITNTATATNTPSNTATASLTATPSSTFTATSTATATSTVTATRTRTATQTPSNTATATATGATSTPTATATRTPSVTPTPPSGLGPGAVGQTTSSLNLRSGPSTGYPVIAVLPKNTQVLVTGYSVTSGAYVFIPVSTSYGDGWVASEYVTLVGTATPTRTLTTTSTATSTRTITATPSATTPGGSATSTATPSATVAGGTATGTPTRTATLTATSTGGYPIGSTVRTTASVNMRTGPGTGFSVITVLRSNTYGAVLDGPTTGGSFQWYQVDMGSQGTGWVAGDYLAIVNGATASPTRTSTRTPTHTPSRTPTTTSGGFPVGSTVRTTAGVNMRQGPGTGYSVITVLPINKSCTVLSGPVAGTGYQWYQLNCSGYGSGWVAGEYLTQVSASSVDTATPIPATETIAATETVFATETAAATETVVVTETATEEIVVMPPVLETETPAPPDPTEEIDLGPPPASPGIEQPPVLETPTDIPVVEAQPLPIARIQRSEGSSPGQVLVDRDAATVWTTDGSAVVPLAAFIVDLDASRYVSVVRWQVGTEGLAGTLHVSVSTDNENWSELVIDNIASPGQWQELSVDASVQYIRFVFVNDDGLDAVGGIAEVEVWP